MTFSGSPKWEFWDWGNGSFYKAFAMQPWRPEFGLPPSTKEAQHGHAYYNSSAGGGGRNRLIADSC